jgi:purine catabolism regulator
MQTQIASRLKNLGHIAQLVNSSLDVKEVLNQITIAVCHRSIWSSSAMHVIDTEIGYSLLCARHDPYHKQELIPNMRWALETSPCLKVIETGLPLIVEDVQISEEYPEYRMEAIERDYHTIVLFPLKVLDENGREMVMSVHAHNIHTVDEDELGFLQVAAQLTSLALEKARLLRVEKKHGEELHRSIEMHTATMELVLSGETVSNVINHVADVINHPFLVIDLAMNQVIPRGSPKPGTMSDAEWERIVSQASIPEFRQLTDKAETSHFSKHQVSDFSSIGGPEKINVIVEPILVDNIVLGYIAVFADGSDFRMYDSLLADEARLALAVMFMREHVRFTARVETHGEFFNRLIHESRTGTVEIVDRGRQLGLYIDEPAKLIILALVNGDMKTMTSSNRAEVLRKLLRHCNLYASGTSIFIHDDLFVAFVPQIKGGTMSIETLTKRLYDELLWATNSKTIVTVSPLCRKPGDYKLAQLNCSKLIEVAKRLGIAGPIQQDDFGPLAELLSSSSQEELRAYVESVLGEVKRYDTLHKSNLVGTMEMFLKENFRYQSCADAMTIHVSTLRYRLEKLNDMFGLDLRVPETRLRVEVALRARVLVAHVD